MAEFDVAAIRAAEFPLTTEWAYLDHATVSARTSWAWAPADAETARISADQKNASGPQSRWRMGMVVVSMDRLFRNGANRGNVGGSQQTPYESRTWNAFFT